MKNVFSKSYHKLAGLTAILAFVLFLAINLLAGGLFSSAQFDLTEDSLYTLSEGTEDTIESIDEQIRLRFFFSNKLANGYPEVKNYASRIQGMLEQYVSLSDGNVTLEVIDPEPFSEEEDLAESFGLQGAPIDNSGTKLYFGLVASNSIDQSQAIPFFVFSRERFAEYDITRMISDLANPQRIKVALISSIPMELPNIPGLANLPDSAGPWAVIQQARQLFDVQTIDIEKDNAKIPEDASLLMVVHPQGFSDDLLYQIDQFVMHKGRAIFFIDPDVANSSDPNTTVSGDAKKLFDKWGIDVELDKVVGDRVYGSPLPQREGDDAQKQLPILSNLTIDNKQSFNPDDIVSANLNTITMTHAAHIEVKKDSGLTLIPLIQSSPRSTLLNVNMVKFGAPTRQLLREFTSDNVAYNLAARIQGPLKSAFSAKDKNFISESTGDVNLIIVGDTDMLRNTSWVKTQNFLGYQMMMPFADNGSFVINAIDNLGGTGSLITLRTRGTGKRPFTVVEELRKKAEERFLNKEKELQEELKRTEDALNRLQNSKAESSESLVLSPAQQLELQRFQQKKLHIRKELRGVQRELNKEIESLGTWLKFINIALMPIIIVIIATFILFRRGRKQAGGR